MILTVTKPVDVLANTISVSVAVRYGEEDIPADAPLRKGDMWEAIIDIDTGKIRNWPIGKSLEMDMKVCDQGTYILYDENDDQLASILENYVPDCIPGRYGDYIEFDISAEGFVKDWGKHCTKEAVRAAFFPHSSD